MLHYSGVKVLMEQARLLTASSVQDNTADNLFNLAVQSLEEHLGGAFDDLEAMAPCSGLETGQ